MGDPFIGSEALRAGQRAKAAFLWTGRRGVVAGRSAAALQRAKWISADRPAQVLWGNRRAPAGIEVWSNNVADDEIASVNGVRATTPARTALDIACRYPTGKAVSAIDALARATRLKMADVEMLAERDVAPATRHPPRLPAAADSDPDIRRVRLARGLT